jgi:hypothetical protein
MRSAAPTLDPAATRKDHGAYEKDEEEWAIQQAPLMEAASGRHAQPLAGARLAAVARRWAVTRARPEGKPDSRRQ